MSLYTTGRGVAPTPHDYFFKEGAPPPPSGPKRTRLPKNDGHAGFVFFVVVSMRNTGQACVKNERCADKRGRGVPPTPPPLFFQSGDHPPPHMSGPWGYPLSLPAWPSLSIAGKCVVLVSSDPAYEKRSGPEGTVNSPGVDHSIHKGRKLGHQHRVEPLLHRKEDPRDIREPEPVCHKVDEP